MGGLFRKPKAPRQPAPTAQEKALGRRQDDALSREIEEENRRKKQLIRGTLGGPSLLTGLTGGPGGTSDFSGVTFAGATSVSTGGGTGVGGSPAGSLLGPTGAPRRVPGSGPRRPGTVLP